MFSYTTPYEFPRGATGARNSRSWNVRRPTGVVVGPFYGVIFSPITNLSNRRFGLHSGPVTAGVLRGQKARFQLFGDVSLIVLVTIIEKSFLTLN